ncbi:MAG: MBL fold metallo-hydrolase [Candidatus Aenigmarchaeota archaeon]|nr:MBL fold metallo-hydrolase [Candidatus Aenigmarchaeota archaeon]
MKIADGIYLLDGAEFDSNMFCIDNELLVDCGSGFFIEETLAQMEEYGIDPKKIKMIVITHAHFDHCGGAKEWKKITGAKVFVHENDLNALETGNGVMAEEYDAEYEGVKADGILREGEEIKTKNYTFNVIHTPGHTPGGICLWDEKKRVLISDDILTPDGVGRSDHPGANEKELLNSLRKIKKLGDIQILLPGHGAPASRYNPYAKDAIKKILEKI